MTSAPMPRREPPIRVRCSPQRENRRREIVRADQEHLVVEVEVHGSRCGIR
jgi:hypothetical protein